jgi:hypothetical protein
VKVKLSNVKSKVHEVKCEIVQRTVRERDARRGGQSKDAACTTIVNSKDQAAVV